MVIEQIYTGCLSQGAYYIHSKGEAAIIDPLREVDQYVEKARADGVTIKYVFETHFHADFVSGHLSLSKRTGAPIIYGPMANPSFDALIAEDEQVFDIGAIKIKVLHTPGHTMESTTYLVIDEDGREHAIFTGDTLFLGDVGRPDLSQKSEDVSMDDLAGYSYDSLRNKILPLPDHVIVYPAHGAGSACGKKMMKETVDTLGNQKKVNYALRKDMTKQEFIDEVADGLLPPPAYFPLNVKMNKEGYEDIADVLKDGLKELSPAQFEVISESSEAVMLDVRTSGEYASRHIPNSIFIGLDGSFAPWVGELIVDVKQPIILIAPEGREREAVTRLSRVGFDNTLGYLKGGIGAWVEEGREVESVSSVDASQLLVDYSEYKSRIFDVRRESEYMSEHILNAINTPLSNLNSYIPEYSEQNTFYIHCAGGYRSMIAASILKSRGIHNLIDVRGGYKEIKETEIPKSEFVCPTTL